MAVIVVGTNSYVTEAELATYASDRGITIAAADTTTLLVRSMDYLETRLYKGYKTVTTQALQFPRVLCADYFLNNDYYTRDIYIPCEHDSETVPNGIKNAQIVAALLIDSGEDLTPTLGKKVIKEKIDVIEIEYDSYSSDSKSFSQLNALLQPFLASAGGLKLARV